jgi:lipopolysaccharide exporter
LKVRSVWFKAVFFTFLQRSSVFVFGVLSYLMIVRGFSKETNGTWALYLAIFSAFEIAKQGLLRNATIKLLGNAEPAKAPAYESASLLLNCAISIAAILFFVSFGNEIGNALKAEELHGLLYWGSINIILLIPFSHCEIILQSKLKFAEILIPNFIRQLLFVGGIAWLYFGLQQAFTLLNVLYIQLASIFIGTIAILFLSYRRVRFPARLTASALKDLFTFGKFTFGTNILATLSRSFDHIVVALLLPAAEGKIYVAYYHTISRINNLVDLPSLAAADVLYPKTVDDVAKDGPTEARNNLEKVTGALLALMLPLALFIFLFPSLIIYIIATEQYYPAVPLLQLTILFSIVRPISYQFGATLDAIGKPDINFKMNILLAASYLALMLIFVYSFGGDGAAYATIGHYVIVMFVIVLVAKKHIGYRVGQLPSEFSRSYDRMLLMLSNARKK